MEGDRAGVVCCLLLEVPEGCSCQVNVLQCTLEGVETVVGKYIRCVTVKMILLSSINPWRHLPELGPPRVSSTKSKTETNVDAQNLRS